MKCPTAMLGELKPSARTADSLMTREGFSEDGPFTKILSSPRSGDNTRPATGLMLKALKNVWSIGPASIETLPPGRRKFALRPLRFSDEPEAQPAESTPVSCLA